MQPQKKFYRPPTNVVYKVDGASYGLDDGLVEAIKNPIRRRIESKALEIPKLSQVAGRILQLSQNPDTTIDTGKPVLVSAAGAHHRDQRWCESPGRSPPRLRGRPRLSASRHRGRPQRHRLFDRARLRRS